MPHNTKSVTSDPYQRVYKFKDLLDDRLPEFQRNKKWDRWNEVFKKPEITEKKKMAIAIAKCYFKEVVREIIISNFKWYYNGLSLRVTFTKKVNNPKNKFNVKTNGIHYFVGLAIENPRNPYRRIKSNRYTVTLHKYFATMFKKEINNFHSYE